MLAAEVNLIVVGAEVESTEVLACSLIFKMTNNLSDIHGWSWNNVLGWNRIKAGGYAAYKITNGRHHVGDWSQTNRSWRWSWIDGDWKGQFDSALGPRVLTICAIPIAATLVATEDWIIFLFFLLVLINFPHFNCILGAELVTEDTFANAHGRLWPFGWCTEKLRFQFVQKFSKIVDNSMKFYSNGVCNPTSEVLN